jgi:Methyltransferase domain
MIDQPSKIPSTHVAMVLIALSLGFLAGFSSTNKCVCSSFQTQDSTDNKAVIVPQEQHNCVATLDALDKTFDQRRQIRVTQTAKQLTPPSAKSYFDLFEPEAVCFTDERFGGPQRYESFGDGPKFICGIDYLRATTSSQAVAPAAQSSSCLVYSVGSKNQIAFEMAIKDLLPACETHTFDPTLTAPYIGDAYSTFHPWGLGADNATATIRGGFQFKTQGVMSMYRALGHAGRHLDILKVDCEGCEFDSMVPLFDAMARNEIQVDQLLIELHIVQGDKPEVFWKKVLDFFAAADRAKMRIFHKERNHWGCNGYNCLEYAFASEDFLRRANADIACGSGPTSSSS